MRKSIQTLLLCSLLFFVGGCSLFQSSETRTAVLKARSDGSLTRGDDPLSAIHSVLLDKGVSHKLVQFRYRVNARPLLPTSEKSGFYLGGPLFAWIHSRTEPRERSGIVYHDTANQKKPWWYFDDKVRRPIWVPDSSVEVQVRFAMHRPVELIRVQDFDTNVTPMKNPAAEPTTTDWSERFKQKHGTTCNPLSLMDTAKMNDLRGN